MSKKLRINMWGMAARTRETGSLWGLCPPAYNVYSTEALAWKAAIENSDTYDSYHRPIPIIYEVELPDGADLNRRTWESSLGDQRTRIRIEE